MKRKPGESRWRATVVWAAGRPTVIEDADPRKVDEALASLLSGSAVRPEVKVERLDLARSSLSALRSAAGSAGE